MNSELSIEESLLSEFDSIKERLSLLLDDESYPLIVYPNSFSSISTSSVNCKGLLDYCVRLEGPLSCLLPQHKPIKPSEPQYHEVPLTHKEKVPESFWKSTNGSILRIWLIVAFLLGALPGYGAFGGLGGSLLMMLLWSPVLLILLARNGRKRGYDYVDIPYSTAELDSLKKNEQKRYENAINDYPYKLSLYEENLSQYNEDMKTRELIMRKHLSSYLKYLISSSFLNSDGFSIVNTPPQKGRSEDTLFMNLMQCMPNSVHIDTVIAGYYPDIMVSIEDRVFIDIEIDEPYEMDTKKEIHYIGGDDEIRNSRIANKEWLVVRFSEKQIMTNCASCTKIIEKLIKLVQYGDFLVLDELLALKNSIKDNRWRKEDARMMSINNYRNTY